MPKHAFIQRGESIYYAFLFIPVGPKGIRVIIPSLAAEYTHKNLMAVFLERRGFDLVRW